MPSLMRFGGQSLRGIFAISCENRHGLHRRTWINLSSGVDKKASGVIQKRLMMLTLSHILREVRLRLHFDTSSCILPVEVKENKMPTAQRIELPQGTLDLLILQTLLLEPQHGWAISERVQQ